MKKLLTIVVILIVILAVGKNFFVKVAVEKGVEAATGLPLKIDKLNIGIVKTHVGIEELNLLNPKGFPEEAMFYAPEIFVDYKLGPLATGKVHLEDIRLNFDRFVIVTNADGKTNLDILKEKASQAKGGDKDAKPEKKKKDMKIQIDHLSLKVGKLIYKDYSKGGEPVVKEYNVNLSEEMSDVTNLQAVLGFIATKALLKTGLNTLVNIDLDALANVKDVSGQVVGTLKNTADTMKNTADSITGTLKDTIKLPFGDK